MLDFLIKKFLFGTIIFEEDENHTLTRVRLEKT